MKKITLADQSNIANLPLKTKLQQLAIVLIWFGVGAVVSFAVVFVVAQVFEALLEARWSLTISDWLLDLLFNPVFKTFFLGFLLYLVLMMMVVILPNKLAPIRQRCGFLAGKLTDYGFTGWLKWREMFFGVASFFIYFSLMMLVFWGLQELGWTGLDQIQPMPFNKFHLADKVFWTLALVILVFLTPAVEEILFRGYLYHKLRQLNFFPPKNQRQRLSFRSKLLAAIITSLVFGLMHGQLNVGIDTFVLSMVACWTVEMTGSVNSAIVLHMIKNALAFYVLSK